MNRCYFAFSCCYFERNTYVCLNTFSPLPHHYIYRLLNSSNFLFLSFALSLSLLFYLLCLISLFSSLFLTSPFLFSSLSFSLFLFSSLILQIYYQLIYCSSVIALFARLICFIGDINSINLSIVTPILYLLFHFALARHGHARNSAKIRPNIQSVCKFVRFSPLALSLFPPPPLLSLVIIDARRHRQRKAEVNGEYEAASLCAYKANGIMRFPPGQYFTPQRYRHIAISVGYRFVEP